MNNLNYKRKLRAFYNRNKKYKKEALFSFIIGVLIALVGYIEYLDFINRNLIK